MRRLLRSPASLALPLLALLASTARAIDIHEVEGSWARYNVATAQIGHPLVDTLVLSTPRIESTADGDAIWFQMEAYWQRTRVFAIAALVSDLSFLDGSAPPAVVHRYLLYPEKGDPLEYVDEATGRAYLPRFGLFEGLLPSAPAGSAQPLFQLEEFLSRPLTLDRASTVDAKPLSAFAGHQVLELDDRVLVGSSRSFRDDGTGREVLNQGITPTFGDYTYVALEPSDYEEMIDAGFNLFRVPGDHLDYVLRQPTFFVFFEGTSAHPDLFYRSNYWGGVMYMDEPDVRVAWQPGFGDIVTPSVAADVLVQYTTDVQDGSSMYGSRYLELMLSEEFWDLGARVDLVEREVPSWLYGFGTSWYQMEAGVRNLVLESRIVPSEFAADVQARFGVDFPPEAEPCIRFMLAAATGATQRFGGSWGVSTFGQMEEAAADVLFPLAYERGARFFWFWSSDNDHHLQHLRQLEIVRNFRDWLETESGFRPRETQPLVAITLPWGYRCDQSNLLGTAPGYLWRRSGIELDDVNTSGVEYREVLAAFYRTYVERIAAGEEVDLVYERPNEIVPLGEYDAIYRVLPTATVVSGTTGAAIRSSSIASTLRVQPNPFARGTSLRFEVHRDTRANVHVYDAAGRRVRTLLREGPLGAGNYTLWWNGRDDSGAPAVAGVYFANVVIGEEKQAEKIVLLR